MIELKKHGSYLEVDKEGFVMPIMGTNKYSTPLIQYKWKPIIEDVIDFYKHHLIGIISIYVRGTVAKGIAVEGLSDLDTFCITKGPTYIPQDILDGFQTEMKHKYLFCMGVEIRCTELDTKARAHVQKLIKTQSIKVYGKDLAPEIQPFKLSEMIGPSLTLKEDLKSTKHYLPLATGPEHTKEICVWISKRILRSAFELVMEKEQKYTRDLYLCYESFSNHYDNEDGDDWLKDILNLAINPISDIDEIREQLNRFTPWLLASLEKETYML